METKTKKISFLKQIGYEIDKSFKVGTIFVILLVALAGVLNFIAKYVLNEYVKEKIKYGWNDITSDYFNAIQAENSILAIGMILACVTGVLVVIFSGYIWFSEWCGSSKSAYLLLNLPVSKEKTVAAKFIVSYMFFLINYGIIVLSKMIGVLLNKKQVKELSGESLQLLVDNQEILTDKFLIVAILLIALIGIMMIFTFSIFNRVKVFLGSALGIVLILIEVLGFIGLCFTSNVYLSDLIIKLVVYGITITVINFGICTYLLKNKVHI